MTDISTKSRKTQAASDTWTVRGVSPETREAVKKAARRSRQTMGAWLDDNLRRVATQTLQEQLPATRMGDDALQRILERLDALEGQKQESASAPPRAWWRRWFGGSA